MNVEQTEEKPLPLNRTQRRWLAKRQAANEAAARVHALREAARKKIAEGLDLSTRAIIEGEKAKKLAAKAEAKRADAEAGERALAEIVRAIKDATAEAEQAAADALQCVQDARFFAAQGLTLIDAAEAAARHAAHEAKRIAQTAF